MILEAAAVAAGLFMTLAKTTAKWRFHILKHPWVFDVCVFICMMMWHGSTGDGALMATLSTLFLSTAHTLARKYYGV